MFTATAASAQAPGDEDYTDPFRAKKCKARVGANLKITQARNMSCLGARRVMRRYDGKISRRFTAPGRFKCRLIKGRVISGVWRCKKSDKAFRFRFGD
jgi:hypothetical protein